MEIVFRIKCYIKTTGKARGAKEINKLFTVCEIVRTEMTVDFVKTAVYNEHV